MKRDLSAFEILASAAGWGLGFEPLTSWHETPRHLIGPDPEDPKEQARVEERIRKAKERRDNRAMKKALYYEKANRKTNPK